MVKKKETDEKSIAFETAVAELETIVQALEKGDLPLEDAVALFEKGVRLSRICSGKLGVAQEKVRKLLVEQEDEILTLPFAETEE